MSLKDLKSNVKKDKKRVGRGNGSGRGTFSGRGCKGQKSRSGGLRRPGFEGGQTPYAMRMPKLRGFRNPNHINYQVVNLDKLNIFEENAIIKKEDLLAKNIISKKSLPVKLLARGEIEKALTIEVDKASQEAIKKIEDKKGKVIILKLSPKKDV